MGVEFLIGVHLVEYSVKVSGGGDGGKNGCCAIRTLHCKATDLSKKD